MTSISYSPISISPANTTVTGSLTPTPTNFSRVSSSNTTPTIFNKSPCLYRLYSTKDVYFLEGEDVEVVLRKNSALLEKLDFCLIPISSAYLRLIAKYGIALKTLRLQFTTKDFVAEDFLKVLELSELESVDCVNCEWFTEEFAEELIKLCKTSPSTLFPLLTKIACRSTPYAAKVQKTLEELVRERGLYDYKDHFLRDFVLTAQRCDTEFVNFLRRRGLISLEDTPTIITKPVALPNVDTAFQDLIKGKRCVANVFSICKLHKMEDAKFLEKCPPLTRMNFRDTSFSTNMIYKPLIIKNSKTLEEANLTLFPIDPNHFYYLAKYSKIQFLNLNYSYFNDEVNTRAIVHDFKKVLQMPTIKRVDCSNCIWFTEALAAEIKEHLHLIDYSGTPYETSLKATGSDKKACSKSP